jgi:hypothetical protein
MKTPDGRECKFYHEDFHRGREVQQCRIPKRETSAEWQPSDCVRCPVPDILLANASPELQLNLEIKRGWWGFGYRVTAHATCRKHKIAIADPMIGCPECNAERPGFNLFDQALRDLE